MKIDYYNDFIALPGKSFRLDQYPTHLPEAILTNKEVKNQLKNTVSELSELQDKLYASNKYSLLIIFQAMDAAGKDGTIKHVMSGINPQGCKVYSFKAPSTSELEHDFLWRTTIKLPERGMIGIFNRSYFEEVLVTRVHPDLILKQRIPGVSNESHISHDFWLNRYESINDFEKHLVRNGTQILKFFLHVSKQEQKKRFLKRIDKKEKNWKFTINDVNERKYWDDYQVAYDEMIRNTSTPQAPWFIIPADKKGILRLAVANILNHKLRTMDLQYPQVSPKKEEYIAMGKKMLGGEDS